MKPTHITISQALFVIRPPQGFDIGAMTAEASLPFQGFTSTTALAWFTGPTRALPSIPSLQTSVHCWDVKKVRIHLASSPSVSRFSLSRLIPPTGQASYREKCTKVRVRRSIPYPLLAEVDNDWCYVIPEPMKRCIYRHVLLGYELRKKESRNHVTALGSLTGLEGPVVHAWLKQST